MSTPAYFDLIQRRASGFEDLVEHGGTLHKLTCADGFRMSVIAHACAYCLPRPGWHEGVPDDYAGPFTHLEVGYPSQRPEPWRRWTKWVEDKSYPTGTVYARVPVQAIRDLIGLHGGEA